jgi:hypothetical protein
MKKRQTQYTTYNKLIKLMVVAIILASFVLIISNTVQAYNCIDGVSVTECVCDYMPNSSLGYGQVIIGGNASIVISCNNNADGVCPEDFSDTSQIPQINASCRNCPDKDCTIGIINGTNVTGYVWGYVKDVSNRPIEKAVITAHPIKWNTSASLDSNVTSGSNGLYNSSEFISGKYYFSASKDGYDTQLIEQTVIRGEILRIDFTLQNGTCHDDCTNSYNRCNAACDGVTFSDSSTQCKFYNNTVRDYCNNKLKGTEVYLGPASGYNASFIKCCDGEPYTKYYYRAYIDSGINIKNLIKNEKIARYNDVPVRIIIAYW